MRVMKVAREGRRPSSEQIFIGAVETQAVVDVGERDLRMVEVHFTDGARNRRHTHTTDQILVITDGEGIVATKNEQQDVQAGDVAYIPAGEEHWHGARPGHDMTHLAITGGTSKTTISDPPEER